MLEDAFENRDRLTGQFAIDRYLVRLLEAGVEAYGRLFFCAESWCGRQV